MAQCKYQIYLNYFHLVTVVLERSLLSKKTFVFELVGKSLTRLKNRSSLKGQIICTLIDMQSVKQQNGILFLPFILLGKKI